MRKETDLDTCRELIDRIDRQIVELLEERFDVVNDVIRYKERKDLPILDAAREQQKLETLAKMCSEQKRGYMEEILKNLDVPAKQVSLEAKIVAISKDASQDLGVEWSWQSHRQPLERSWRQRWEQESYIKDPNGSTIRYGIGPGALGYNVYLDAKVDALVTSGKAKLLSRPNITTLQGHEAVIEIGGEVPVPEQTTANNITTNSIKYRKAGIILRYTPRVNEFGDITASVHTEVSSPLYVDDIKAYRFQTRSADTNVRLRDGETMVIGGLIGSEEAQRLSKIPFLGDLPILGHFFRHTSKSNTESELLIFLKARILEDKDMIVTDTERIEENANGNKNLDSR